jgi:hypothetical protein
MKTRAFTELQSHNLFSEKFGPPSKGNDKGKVEGLVGYSTIILKRYACRRSCASTTKVAQQCAAEPHRKSPPPRIAERLGPAGGQKQSGPSKSASYSQRPAPARCTVKAQALTKALNGRRAGNNWMARCPAHDDRGTSETAPELQDCAWPAVSSGPITLITPDRSAAINTIHQSRSTPYFLGGTSWPPESERMLGTYEVPFGICASPR